MEASTRITTLFDKDSQQLVTDTNYPIYSDDGKRIISEFVASEITKIFIEQKLNRYYDCIQKAKIVANYLNISHIVLGALMVDSTENGVSYGYMYNPPLELHAWVIDNVNTHRFIDFALAGTIEKGLLTKDDVGPFLVDRQPIILAGRPASWMHYVAYDIVSVKSVRLMKIEDAKKLLNI